MRVTTLAKEESRRLQAALERPAQARPALRELLEREHLVMRTCEGSRLLSEEERVLEEIAELSAMLTDSRRDRLADRLAKEWEMP